MTRYFHAQLFLSIFTILLAIAKPVKSTLPRKLAVPGIVISDINGGAGSYSSDPAACSLELDGWEKHDKTFPVGKWEAYFADSPAACVEACAARSDRCIAVLWENATVLPYSDDAKCQFVSKLAGMLYNLPDGIALYTQCASNCGTEIAGYERHANAFPVGQWGPFFADNAAACTASCTAHAERCVGALWIDTPVLPYADDAKCQFVSTLDGVTPGMPDGIDLYLPC